MSRFRPTVNLGRRAMPMRQMFGFISFENGAAQVRESKPEKARPQAEVLTMKNPRSKLKTAQLDA